jgi:Xaa-Pro dipeptidase
MASCVGSLAGAAPDSRRRHTLSLTHRYLRCTRILQPGMVLTIEPGIYFIESLLAPWREGQFSKHFNWQKIEALKPFGGIRIEDNVVIHENSVENMTRDLKLA